MDLNQITNELLELAPQALLQLYLLATVLDIASGFMAAKIAGDFTSRQAADGVMRQALRLMFFVAAQIAMFIVKEESTTLVLVLATFQVAMIVAYGVSLKENFNKINTTNRNQEEA